MDGISLARLGNLHLVLLHLPIGFVVAAGLLELRRWRRPSAEGDLLQGRLLAVNAVAALLTAGAGLVLAATGKYPAETLELHRWAGVVCAGLAVAAWVAQARARPLVARVALAALFGATVVAGHFGATLTHGPEATVFWGSAAVKTVKPFVKPVVKPTVDAAAASNVFADKIQPVLERSCIECHGPNKIKGRLRLDSREAALAGGRSGKPAIKPGRPEASELLRRIRLPRDDEEAMPSGGDPSLSVAEIDAFEKWILAGAPWH
jgi:mono/diheme cytochrome c family protein